MVNTAIDWLRARKRLVPADDEYLAGLAGHEDPPGDVDLQRALGRLPTDYRTVVVLRYFEELKLQEIAEITAVNLSTVKTRLYRALELLRVEMEAEENG